MNNSKKYLFLAIGILLILLISILILQSFLSHSNTPTQLNPFPTTYSVNQYRQNNTNNTNTSSQNTVNSINSTSTTPLVQATNQMNELKKKLPLETNDYVIKYAPNLDKLVVTRKTQAADQAFASWAREKGYPLLIDNNQTTIISDKTMEEVQTPYPTRSPEQQLGTLFTLINLLLQPPTINNSSTLPTPSQTSSSSSSNQISTSQSSSTSSSPSAKGLTYYPQCGGPYDKYPMTASCNICDAGCGPTSVAMILSSYVDSKYTPPAVVEIYKAQNAIGCGTKITDAKNVLELNGVETSDYILGYDDKKYKADEVVGDFKSYIQNGWTIFTLAHFDCTGKPDGCYHFFWITDIDEKGNIMAYDPYYSKNVKTAINENTRYPDPTYLAAFGVKKQ